MPQVRSNGIAKMSIFNIDGWLYEPLPRKNKVVFTKPGQTDIWIRTRSFWQPGMPALTYADGLLPRQSTVERTMRRKALYHPLVGRDVNTDGGVQNGSGIYVDINEQPRDFAWLDGMIERHGVSATHWSNGTPLTRENGVGYEHQYVPLRNDGYATAPYQLPAYVSDPSMSACALWQRYDPAHGARGYQPAVACLPDPVALWQIVHHANDVMLAQPLAELADGGQSLGSQLKNAIGPARASAWAGEVRARAWDLGAVTQAYKAVAPEYREPFRLWMRAQIKFVAMIQADSGAYTRGQAGSAFQNAPWIDMGDGYAPLPADVECETWWESCFLSQTLYDAAMSLGEREPIATVKAIIRKRRTLLDSLPAVPGEWGGMGPWKFLVVAKAGSLEPSIVEGKGRGNNSYNGYFLKVCQLLGIQ